MNKLSDLPNIGKVVESQLEEVGITSYEELKEAGAENAWLRIKAIDDSACMNRLLGIEGAIQKIRKSQLSEERRAELREFFKSAK